MSHSSIHADSEGRGLEHEASGDSATAATYVERDRGWTTARSEHARVLELQRLIGNSAVHRYLLDRPMLARQEKATMLPGERPGIALGEAMDPMPGSHDASTRGSKASRLDPGGTGGEFQITPEGAVAGETIQASFNRNLDAQIKLTFGDWATPATVQKLIETKQNSLGERAKLEVMLFQAREYAVVETLNVEKSDRYKPVPGTTYCNIYAYDVTTLLGAYLPRVWWNPKWEKALAAKTAHLGSIAEYRNAQAKTPKDESVVAAIWNETTHELSANALDDWMLKWGAHFGWANKTSAEEAQKEADEGKVVIALAAKKDAKASGHVSVILAQRKAKEGDSARHMAPTTTQGKMAAPLQSMAGASTLKYGDKTDASVASSEWWKAPDMRTNQGAKGEALGNFWVFSRKPAVTAIALPDSDENQPAK